MTPSLERLKHRQNAYMALFKILDQMDPASGVTFCVRRGVYADNEDVPDDRIRRPWVIVETGELDLAREAIETLLRALEKSISLNEGFARADLKELLAYFHGPDAQVVYRPNQDVKT